jgi:hypothetical protein
MKQLLIAIDQLINVLFGSGWADETISAWSWRTKHWLRPWIDRLFFWQENHCLESYRAEIERQQLPPEYRELTV